MILVMEFHFFREMLILEKCIQIFACGVMLQQKLHIRARY